MNNKNFRHYDLVVRTLEALGYPRVDGKKDEYSGSLEGLMPWLAMDTMYCIFHDAIEKYPCRFELRKIRNGWLKEYRTFNHAFWHKLKNEDDKATIVDIMDKMRDALNNDIVRLRLALASQVPTDKDAVRYAIADAYLCQVVCQIAETLYERIFRVPRLVGRPRQLVWEVAENASIKACGHAAMCWYSYLARANGITDIHLTEDVYNLNGALCRAFVRFIRKENEEE